MRRRELASLVLGSYIVKSGALLLSFLFVLVAPNIMDAAFPDYVFYTRSLAFLALILAFGSAGTISRFARELDNEGISALLGGAFHVKYRLTLLMILPVGAYAVITDNYVFLALLLLALAKALLDTLLLLAYALEHYREKVYFQFLHASGRLLMLPLFAMAQTAYIAITELLGYIPALRACLRHLDRRHLLSAFCWHKRKPAPPLDASTLSRVEYQTYFSNLLYYLLPIAPVLVFNHQATPQLREMTISYVLAVNVVYALASAVNDVVLPRLVAHRNDLRRLAMFLVLSLMLAGLTGGVVYPLFDLFEIPLARFYGLDDLDSFGPFLLFGMTLVVLNGTRQVMFVRDRSQLFTWILAVGYAFLGIRINVGIPLIDTLTPLSLLLLSLSLLLAMAVLGVAARRQ